jgi:hypothetical protein
MIRKPPPTAQAFLAEVAATADTQQMMADCAVLPERLGRTAAAALPVAISAIPAATAQNIRVTCLLMDAVLPFQETAGVPRISLPRRTRAAHPGNPPDSCAARTP